jgi:large repetitive protein
MIGSFTLAKGLGRGKVAVVFVLLLGGTVLPALVSVSSAPPSEGPSASSQDTTPVAANPPVFGGGALSAAPVAPESPGIDAHQSILLTANPSGGTPPYGYQWYESASNSGACDSGNPVGTNSSTNETGALDSAASPYYYCYNVTDAEPVNVSSPWDAIAVNPALSPGAVTPSSPTIDYGQAITLAANPTGGTSPDSYQWYWSSSGVGSCSSASPLGIAGTQTTGAEITGAGGYDYCYVVTDSSMGDQGTESGSSPWNGVTVNPALTAPGTPTPSANTIDADEALTVTATVPTSGTPSYSWEWLISVGGGAYKDAAQCGSSASGTGAAGGATETCSIPGNTLTASTSDTFELEVTDSAATPESQVSPASSAVSVSAALSAGSVSPSSPSIDTGQSITLTANPSGGSSPYSYQWYSASVSSGSCSSGAALGTSGTQAVSPTASKFYCYVVTDSAHPAAVQSSGWTKVTVDAALSPGSATPSSPVIDYGQTITLTASPSGGVVPYLYHWYWSHSSSGACNAGTGLGTGSTQGTGSEITGAGAYYYCYEVTDSSQASGGHESGASPWDLVTVSSALTAPGKPTPSAAALDVNQGLTVTGEVPSTGTPAYAWQWMISHNGGAYTAGTQCAIENGTAAGAGSTETCTIGASALISGDTYTFELRVSDSASTPASKTSSTSSVVTVHSALTAPAAPTPSLTSLDADQPLTVGGKLPSTGTPDYSWQWLVATGSGYANATQCGASASGSGATGGATETCTIPGDTLTASTSYTFELKVNDSATTPETKISAASSTVTTSSELTAGTPTPSSPSIGVGESITLTANPSGGSGSYSFQWYSGATATGCTGLGSPISAATASTYVASPSSSTYYCYFVTDSHSGTATSAADLVTVNSALTAPATPAVSGTALDADQPLMVTGTIPTTGTPAYSWQWLVSTDAATYTSATECAVDSGTGGNGGSPESCSVVANSLTPGDQYSFELKVTDSAATPETATSAPSSPVSVASALTAPEAPALSETDLNVDQTLTVTSSIPTTGTPSYSWDWLISTDDGSYSRAAECGASANGSGAAAGATEVCSVAAGTLTVGESYAFEIQVSDGASTPESQTSSPSSTLTTSSALTAASPSPAAPIIDKGQSVTLSASPSGGSGNYSYQWYTGSTAGGCTASGSPIPGATSSTYAATPSITTDYCYVATDGSPEGSGEISAASAWDLVTVNAPLTPPPPPTGTVSTLAVNQALTLTGTIPSSGTAPYSWQWLVSVNGGAYQAASECAANGGSGASGGATEACVIAAGTFAAGSVYVFELRVTDSAMTPVSQTSSPTAAISVIAATEPPTSSGFPWFWVYEGTVLAAIAAVVLGLLLALRRRRGHARVASPSLPLDDLGLTASPPGTGTLLASPVLESPAVRGPTPSAVAATPAAPPVYAPVAPPPPPKEDLSDIASVMAELDEISAEMVRRVPRKATTSLPEGAGDRSRP